MLPVAVGEIEAIELLRIRTGLERDAWTNRVYVNIKQRETDEIGSRQLATAWRLRFPLLQNQEPHVPIPILHNVPVEEQQSCLYVVTSIGNDSKAKKKKGDIFYSFVVVAAFFILGFTLL